MLGAVLDDLARLPGIEVATLLTMECREQFAGWVARHPDIRILAAEQMSFCDAVRSAEATLLIAPELDHVLEARCRCIEAEGRCLLGCTAAAVRLTADKLTLARHWGERGVPTPETRLATLDEPPFPFPVVCKPRFGAGSTATVLVRHTASYASGATGEDRIVQPFIPGLPVSVAFLVGSGAMVPLLPAAQHLSDDGRFHYRGGTLPLSSDLAARAARLGRQALATVPGLRGYVGVDLILGPDTAGRDDQAIEINPRLTTSYVGLRDLATTNLAESMLRAALGQPVPTPAWRAGSVSFTADGRITVLGDQSCAAPLPALPASC